ncbi:putative MPP superfamily phosphohydrolase [Streptosporangium becharense]|uniref:Putative MPP superfamily phosphohydrolase n=1 Tax=Streptosporangium becharense TaxID=1816182 RepID=A0A7W9MHQ8_9ACTN|nr:metallophosphoesterase [Streptosporangium becharense]MBB2912447.1 putative MPP superfamily phosphohydrolase [Streptosporangium becharense]MBB5820724.1 putative MPP superfamily phosphohydrolase [Streptosporangium becharense]
MNIGRWTKGARRFATGRIARGVAVVAVAIAGAWLGIVLGGSIRSTVGPVELGMAAEPSWTGETVVDAHPFGTLLFDTHDAPVGLRVTLENINPDRARGFLDDPQFSADRLPRLLEEELGEGVRTMALRAGFCGLAGALVVALVVFRRPGPALAGMLSVAVAMAGTGAATALTFRPDSVVEPKYTGLLAGAPSLVGDAESIVTRFESYRVQLAKIVNNVSQLYDTVSSLPVYDADPTSIRVLHVSDIHLNPIGWNLIRSVTAQFEIDLIIDTGDLTDHGTGPEDRFVEEIGTFGVPYVFVRGNHDSKATQRAVAKQKGAVVLDGAAQTVAGLRIYGLGDPRFTPDKSVPVDSDLASLEALGRSHAAGLAQETEPVDLVAVHDPTIAKGFSGAVPMVLTGHSHERSTELLPSGTRVLVQGSTGGAGLRALEHDEPTPVAASVLYFDRATHRLRAWDDITLGGLGEQSVQIQRHVEADPGRTISPVPTVTPSPAGSASATPTP